ncbi:helix-turn-helix transcriptional regulator [Escherichia coli]|uniref:helix-turn-helix domain-containing protein n=1 Tax=Escherichia coli TaxID=562 RepID=UPI0001DC4AE3|nr:helix-turn-helix transcriptional regulator [Escherichia coli]EET4255381.1 helix-turn-helix transcriptional regulator [Escherichia coli]EET8201902.1 helix-turn-helix transcriptional regulator [Escherichia coli]EET9084618.1 helix-turn-helix transcriptional regulator [Escherichia coli]EET9503629.1 helix-turn-helix transcriptional regulator [Escherichia coli]EEU2580891.1 helix-turn-helix transcriptional regulator [Escherichia coli]
MSNAQITSQAEKLALIRESERMTRKQVAELTGINYNTYAGYEQGKVKMSFDAGMKFFKPERFRKYRDWFMFDETDPAGGQIAPALAHIGQDSTTLHHSDQKTG